jgi:hypothetical protein
VRELGHGHGSMRTRFEVLLYLLQMRKKLDAKFTDKKTVKNSLWQEIADLNRSEFSVGTGLEALTVLIRYWFVIRALEE